MSNNILDLIGHKDRQDEPADFTQFALNGNSEAMKQQMLDDKFVLGRLAILGQWTTFYASPNSGKTLLSLHLLIEGIKSGEVTGTDVFFVNADDTFKGLVQKTELAERHGFTMLAPGHKGFKAKMMIGILDKMTKADSARGKVIIIDTLKKFTDLMDKKTSSAFGETAREFVSCGGSIIGMAHTNKHKGSDGKSIHAGTSDIKDDNDCTYIVDTISVDGDTKTVQFENIKNRGDVAEFASYKYTKEEGQDYFDLLDSVSEVSEEKAAEERAAYRKRQFMEEKREVVNEIVACINGGITLKTKLIKEVSERTTETQKTVKRVLTMGTGTGSDELQFWITKTGEHNSQIYSLNEQTRFSGAVFNPPSEKQ